MRITALLAVILLAACTGIFDQYGSQDIGDDLFTYNGGDLTDGGYANENGLIRRQGSIIRNRIMVPEGFERVAVEQDTFGEYLRNLPLKPHGSKVLYYDGSEKRRDVYSAVIDMDIGDRDLQQCADAVIRLRAEFLYKQQQYDKIHFNFTNGFTARYDKWRQGYRISVNGNDAKWIDGTGDSTDYRSFRKYLDMIFAYAGTLSLAKELKNIDITEIKIGDVFIQGGSPGHCVIVVDMAKCTDTGEKLVLLAQSYMPAQDIHILRNLQNPSMSPWYSLDFGDWLITPEWTFDRGELMGFDE